MVKVLEKAGCEVHYNSKQTCCGQLAINSGFWGEAKKVARKFIKDFSNDRYIIGPSGSCVGCVRNYYTKLFEGSGNEEEIESLRSNLFEFSEFLIDVLKVKDFGAKLEGLATYHDACGALRECGIKQAPRELLENVEGLNLVEMEDVETCCGFGGTFAVKHEAISIGMVDQKVEHAIATKAEYIISTDLSCLMHIDGYLKRNKKTLRVMHLADVLASGW